MAPYTRFAGNPGFICFEFAGNRVIVLFKFAGNPEIVCFEFAGEIKIALFCGIDSIVTLWIRRYSNLVFETDVRGWLGRMMFSGEEATKKANVLSGGERVRLALCKIFKRKPKKYRCYRKNWRR